MLQCKCGKSIADDFRFCPYCGAPLQEPLSPTVPWETCQILLEYEGAAVRIARWYAVADGPSGRRRLAESEWFPWVKGCNPLDLRAGCAGDRNYTRTQQAFDALVTRLIDKGWEVAGTCDHWSQQRLRRAV